MLESVGVAGCNAHGYWKDGGPSVTRTPDLPIMSRVL